MTVGGLYPQFQLCGLDSSPFPESVEILSLTCMQYAEYITYVYHAWDGEFKQVSDAS